MFFRQWETFVGNLARDSQWALNFGELKGVYVTKVTGEDQTQTTTIKPENYHVYYYTGDLDGSDSYQSLYNSVKQLGYGDINNLPEKLDQRTSIG